MKGLHYVTFTLLIIGGLNWLLVGLFQWDLVMWLGNVLAQSWLPTVLYVLVGLSAVWEVVSHSKNCRMCGSQSTMM